MSGPDPERDAIARALRGVVAGLLDDGVDWLSGEPARAPARASAPRGRASPTAGAAPADAAPPAATRAAPSRVAPRRAAASEEGALVPELVWETPPAGPRAEALTAIRSELGLCTRCRLCEGRQQLVFGEGNPDAPVVFVGEGPGADEDRTGRPFVGRAGELLTRMIAAVGWRREEVYICNVVKCRPPQNRDPRPDEVASCSPFLVRQLQAIAPRAIVALGRPATQSLLGRSVAITRLRGIWQEWRGVPLMPTYHPAYLLRNYTRETRQAVWDDLRAVRARVDSASEG